MRPAGWMVTVMVLALDAGAIAQPSAVPPAADDRGRSLYLAGEDAYAAGDYEIAVRHFRAAHTASGKPSMLLRVSDALERLGRFREAADALRQFVADAGGTREVTRRIANLDARATAATPRARDAAIAFTPAPPPGHPTGTWLTLGLGGLAALTAGSLWIVSGTYGSRAGEHCHDDLLCSEAAAGDRGRQRDYAIAGDVSALVAVVAGTAAVVWLRRPPRGSDRVGAVPLALPGGAGVGVAGGF